MGWEERNGSLYYYEKERTADGRVVSKYIGNGKLAHLVSEMNRGRRIEKKMKQRRFEEMKRRLREERRAVDEVQETIRAAERAALLLNGYHTHKGQWRKRRGKAMGTESEGAVPIRLKESEEELGKIMQRTNTEDPAPEDLRALRKALREDPDLWERVASTAGFTERGIIWRMADGNALVRESVTHGARQLREELGREDAPALERLLIDQVALCWVHFQKIQRHYTDFTNGRYVVSEAEHLEKRVDAAQRRYLRAVKTLARVRKMAGRDVLQINIGGQHVNVAG